MVDENADQFGNQRPVVIGAIILAALLAAGLWYFFVFRPADTPEPAVETATPTPVASESPLAPVAAPEVNTAPTSAPAAAGSTHVVPTAPTGIGEGAFLAAALAMMAGWRGLWRRLF